MIASNFEPRFAQAQTGILGCSVHGGRYWEAKLDLVNFREVPPRFWV